EFLRPAPGADVAQFPTVDERQALATHLGFDLDADELQKNLERLMEVLFSFQFVLKRTTSEELTKGVPAIDSVISKVTAFVTKRCSEGLFEKEGPGIVDLYQAFYRKLL